MAKVNIHFNGDQMGCTDQGAPEDYTPAQLSRLHDTLLMAQATGLGETQVKAVFSSFPETMKLEYNYSNWRYTT